MQLLNPGAHEAITNGDSESPRLTGRFGFKVYDIAKVSDVDKRTATI